MAVSSGKNLDVKIHCCGIGYCIKEFLYHLCSHISYFFRRKLCIPSKIRSSGKIYCAEHKHFIHRKDTAAVTFDPFFVANCLTDSISKDDPCIFNGVMIIYIQITVDSQRKIIQSMARKTVQHMVKKANTCINIGTSCSINIQLQTYLRFFCVSFDQCFSCHYSFSLSSSSKRTAMEFACAVSCSDVANWMMSLWIFRSASLE